MVYGVVTLFRKHFRDTRLGSKLHRVRMSGLLVGIRNARGQRASGRLNGLVRVM